MATVSARPDNLAAYRSKLEVMDWDLRSTASSLLRTLQAYRIRCREFGADHTELAHALSKHATAMEELDGWVGRVGEAFRQADRAPGLVLVGIALTTEESLKVAGPDKPPIPSPPPNPPTDPGAGEHGVDPWYTRSDDLFYKGLAYDAANAAELIGWTHAAAHLRHYLRNSGTDFTVNPDEIMRDVDSFRGEADRTVAAEMRRIAAEAAANGTYGKPVQFSTGWAGHYIYPGENKDWYYAMGGIRYSVTGVATVYPPDQAGGQPRIAMDYQVHVFDRYNWDVKEKKNVEIGPITITDEFMAAMHRAGVAQEFNMSGSTKAKHYTGAVPPPGQQPELPQPPDNRDGTRTDPGRN